MSSGVTGPVNQMPAAGAPPFPLDQLGETLLHLYESLCRPPWLETLLPDRWRVLADPVERLNEALSPLAAAAWAETPAGAFQGQAEEWPTGSAGVSVPPAFPRQVQGYIDKPVSAASPVPSEAIPAREPVQGQPTSTRPPTVSRVVRPQTVGWQPAIRLGLAGRPPGARTASVTPARASESFLQPGISGSSAALPVNPPDYGAENEARSLPAQPVQSPLSLPLAPARGGDPQAAFTGARLATDPARLAVVLQANLHARDKTMPASLASAGLEAGAKTTTGPSEQPFTLQPSLSAPQPQPVHPRDDENRLDGRTSVPEPLDVARLEQIVGEQFDRWLEEVEFAYLRTYGTSGV
jgi:hypothetical protein